MANKGNYYIGIRLLLLKQFLEYNSGPNRYVTRKQIEKFLKEKGISRREENHICRPCCFGPSV